MAKLGLEARTTIKELSRRGMSHSSVARTLGATDGRRDRQFPAARLGEHVEPWLSRRKRDEDPVNLAVLYDHLVEEHAYARSKTDSASHSSASRT